MREEYPLLIALRGGGVDAYAKHRTSRTGGRVESYEDALVLSYRTDHRRSTDGAPRLRPKFVEETGFFICWRAMNENDSFGDDLSPLCPRLCGFHPGGRSVQPTGRRSLCPIA